MAFAERVVRPKSLPERSLRMLVELFEDDPAGFEELAILMSREFRPLFGSITLTMAKGGIVGSEVKTTRKVAR